MARDKTQQTTGTEEQRSAGTAQPYTPPAGETGRGRQEGQQPDRERSIDTTRERGRQATGLARQPGWAPARGRDLAAHPYALMQRMAEDMDRLFEGFGIGRPGLGLMPTFGSLFAEPRWGGALAGGPEEARWTPQVEMFRRGDQLVVRADLPGMRKEDVHVNVENDVLTLRGERREEHEENREDFYRSERSYGSFYRAIPLPEGTDPTRCEARYQDGVLEITIPEPKQEERKSRRIEIH